ncbi:MAG: MarR family winged helix-turn-helix transcriptional regulator [Desulfobacterales bacterium]|nr:MarR family winged helix-turn-helix transcriptional regulator [Desulfobacterales bacterium]
MTQAYSNYTLVRMSKHNMHTIHDRFRQVMKLAVQMEQTPRPFGTDELLTSSEIHLVEIIGENGESQSVTDLAGLLAVTKGAVSQTLKKLEKKGMTTKHPDPVNSSRAIVELTTKGKTAFYAHRHWHETMDGGFKEYFENLNQDRIDFLVEFLAKFEVFLKKVLH